MTFGLVCIFIGLVVLVIGLAFMRGAHGKPTPVLAHVRKPDTRKRYSRTTCEFCLRNVAASKDGTPIRNRHKCHIPEPKGDAV